jgi:hypothetical protein
LTGPAVVTSSVSIWYNNDVVHREDGPAIEYTTGNKSWYINGTPMSEEQFALRTA